MRAKRKAVAALAALVLCLSAAAAALTLYQPAQAGAAVPVDLVYEITSLPLGEVRALAISNRKAVFGLVQEGGELTLVSGAEGQFSVSELRALLYAACHLTGSREITDLSGAGEYGLDDPLARITLIKADGTEENLALLSQNPMSGDYYLFSESKQAIYLISPAVAELFLRQETDFLSRMIFPLITPENYGGVESLSLDFRGGGRSYTLEYRPEGFVLTQPILQPLPATAVMEQLLRPISGLYADAVVAQGADLNEFGFDDDTLGISLTFQGTTYTAWLLDREDGTMYMANPDTGAVYELDSGPLAALTRDYLTLTGANAFFYAAGDLRNFSVAEGTREALFELSGQGEGLTAAIRDKKLTAAEITALLSVLNACGIAGEAEGGDGGEAALTLTFVLHSGRTDRVDFLPAPGGAYFVSLNGVVNFTTTAAAVQAIRAAAFSWLE